MTCENFKQFEAVLEILNLSLRNKNKKKIKKVLKIKYHIVLIGGILLERLLEIETIPLTEKLITAKKKKKRYYKITTSFATLRVQNKP